MIPTIHQVWEARIPRKAFKAGDMVRWRLRAKDAAGYESVFPLPDAPPPPPRAFGSTAAASSFLNEANKEAVERLTKGASATYHGTMVRDPAADAAGRPPPPKPPAAAAAAAGADDAAANGTTSTQQQQLTLPTLFWFAPDVAASISRAGDGGSSALFYDGRLYQGVRVRRRGVTALNWRKPKLSMDVPGGFVYK